MHFELEAANLIESFLIKTPSILGQNRIFLVSARVHHGTCHAGEREEAAREDRLHQLRAAGEYVVIT